MLSPMLRILSGLALLLFIASLPARADESPQPEPQVVIKTSEGDITLRLFPDKSPVTVANFLAYVDAGHYNGTIFHRVISGFMIQGGGFLPDLTEKPAGDPIINESRNRLHNIRGAVTMARTSDPDSAAAQFFINQRTNLQLDWSPGKEGYTVFGEVIDGMSVVDYISSAPVHTVAGHEDVPTEPILILSVEREPLP
ncbi:peptidylprolyl isomerase [Kineobactrum salinum]|uniref:Peptidyl-prolyl cis-trans isomerase n=1 Tax=Kineobactrum salinum TaxID=2708301 RepID=A0A6C0U7L2_9GAMM|nr:peptidylprolyl isomerase [Kineobactrum salinum]QIB66435.1 peptidyl-prolyl cis-trans isomerase [Kineobactrum salinum]